MAKLAKFLQGAAGAAGAGGLDIDEVFSTYLFKPNTSGNFSVTNNIDLDGEGGLVWLKQRDVSANHLLYDTNRGASAGRLASNLDNGEALAGVYFDAFNSDGFTVKDMNADEMASWTFRKAPKFFDCVQYTGDGVFGRSIPHNLGCEVGSIIVKRTDAAASWYVYHRGVDATAPQDYTLVLDLTLARINSSAPWADTAPTTTHFTVGDNSNYNASGGTYVAYLFAHNDGDGGFGPDSDQDIIKCGSYTGNDSTNGPVIDLGFEPQFVLIKSSTATYNWMLIDNMRGAPTGGTTAYLNPNKNEEENTASGNLIDFTSTGFKLKSGDAQTNNNETYIYMAIRRGPLAPPETGTEVFAIDTANSTSNAPPVWNSGFPVDMAFYNVITGGDKTVLSRMTGDKYLKLNATNAEATDNDGWDFMNGWYDDSFTNSNFYSWMWKRAPSFFDVSTYTGNGTNPHNINHNLGVAPEMMWVKRRDSTGQWEVYYDTGNPSTNNGLGLLRLNSTGTDLDGTFAWGNTHPTDSVFTVGSNNTNQSGGDFIAYLFASLAGVSKVGSYTGTGNSGGDINVDCGFTSGARFVLIKRTDASGSWWVADTARGIVTGNEPLLALNDTSAEITGFNMVKPYSAGFIVNGSGGGDNSWNDAGGSYIFYAIA